MDGSLKLSDFLHPASMLTPGIAGSITMMIANVLSAAFQLEPRASAFTGLAISFFLGTLLITAGVALWSRIVYYVVNSLIIFCMAFGSANLVGNDATNEANARSAGFSLIGSAYAAPAPGSDANAKSATLSQAEINALLKALKEAIAAKDPNDPVELAAREQIAKDLHELQRQLPPPAPAAEKKTASRPFFQQWKF